MEATKTAVGVAIASTSEWAGSIEDETTKKRSVEVIIKYAHPVQLTGESLRLIQALEEDAWKNLIREMKKKGFPLFRPSELVGKWSWDWKEGGVDEGTIIFELKQDRTFEADLKPTGVLVPGQVVSWGDGKWKLDGGRLVITMYRVGKRILGKGIPIKEHTEKWIDKEVKRFSPGEQILFTDGDELQYQADKK